MRAIQVTKHGGPDVLREVDLPQPEPGPGDLLVEVAAAGVNFIDVYQREGRYPVPTPFVLGLEGAGTVTAVGEGVTTVAVGERVAWAQTSGSYAAQALVPADRAFTVPDQVDDRTAAAIPLQGMTAHYLVTDLFRVEAGQTVLVHAAAGGVGLLLVQLCKRAGARVLATCSTDEKEALARGAGADEVIRYETEDVAARVTALTDGEGVHVVYDGVGASTFEGSMASLRPRGMMALFGGASGPVPPFDLQRLSGLGSLFVTRPTLAHYVVGADLQQRGSAVLAAVADGLDVRVGATFDLGEAATAHRELEGRRTTGKVLLLP